MSATTPGGRARSSGDCARALERWTELLGEERARSSPESLQPFETATFETTQRVSAVLRPVSTSEVQECLRIAGHFRVPLYPVSRGRNWGLGSAVPPVDGCVVMDLSLMNRIVDFSERDAYLTVQPGVTFQQASDFLRDSGSELMLSCTGGPKDGSVLANALERGDGVGPYGNRIDTVCNLEVVLPSGDLMRTGPGRMPLARNAALTRDVPGPVVDGLFTQSNLGVVTEMTVWLMPVPAFHRSLQFRIADLESLPEFLDEMRGLVLRGVIHPYSAGIWNSYKLFMSNRRYPWSLTGGATPFRLGEFVEREPWYGNVLVYAPSKGMGRMIERHVTSALGPLSEEVSTATPSPLSDRSSLGIPGDHHVRSVYWRKTGPPGVELHPERDRCGVVWVCPALPFHGAEVARIFRESETIVHDHGFEPSIGLNCVSPRCLHAFVMLAYDRDIAGDDQRAMACHDVLLERFHDAGYPPFRLGTQSMPAFYALSGSADPVVGELKRHLDPNGILAPGRYAPAPPKPGDPTTPR